MGSISQLIRVNDDEAVEMLRALADMDQRSMGKEVAWLIRREFTARGLLPPAPDVNSDGLAVTSSAEVIE
jgi:hypothetical protein